VITRARAMLRLLEGGHLLAPRAGVAAAPAADQLALFDSAADPLLGRLRDADTDHLTPMQALELLAALAREARERP
jgi:hypothetical protein